MKLFAALYRFLHRPQPPTLPVPAQFDDGLTEIARLIAADNAPPTSPDTAAPPKRSDAPDRTDRQNLPGRR